MGLYKKLLPFILVLFISLLFFSNHLFFSIFDSRDMLNTSVSIYELRDMSVAVETNLATGEQVINYSKYGLGLPLFLFSF